MGETLSKEIQLTLLPEFQVGLTNGWLPLLLYFIGFILSVFSYSKESRTWLFNNPRDRSNKTLSLIRLIGQLMMVAFIVMMVFTPLKLNSPMIIAGAVVYVIGYVFVMSALYFFRKAPIGQPVVDGPYRLSRNPQWVGLFLVFLGSSIATGVWLYIAMIIVVGFIYHIQILDEETVCINKYGGSYREYMARIPRYLLFM
jgi:protein-S-isoprenylcysteine O-methyltransferase Ste14